MTAEEWRPVVGYEGSYEVSSLGRLRSMKTWRGQPGPRLMKTPRERKGGYLQVKLMDAESRGHTRLVHHLVTEAFLGPRPIGLVVRHLDGDATNANVDNLAYGTPSDNVFDAVRHGTHYWARRTHCIRGHDFADESIVRIDTSRGSAFRRCLQCARDRRRALADTG